MENGSVSILNVGEGDTKLTFDPAKPDERERAAKIVTDMLKRGYAILVDVGEKDGDRIYRRAKGFDPTTCEYLIVGLPTEEEHDIEDAGKKKRRGRPGRIGAHKTRAVAVARSARGCTGVPW